MAVFSQSKACHRCSTLDMSPGLHQCPQQDSCSDTVRTFPAATHGELDNAQNLHNEHRQAEKTPWAQLVFVDVAWGSGFSTRTCEAEGKQEQDDTVLSSISTRMAPTKRTTQPRRLNARPQKMLVVIATAMKRPLVKVRGYALLY